MAEQEISEILRTVLERQSDFEKVQATHEQVLSNLVQSSEHIVERMEKVEEGMHTRFDRIEEGQKFPVGHVIAFLSVVVALVGLTFAGFAYYINLSYKPAEMQLESLAHSVELLSLDTKKKLNEDDAREGDDKARFSTIESQADKQEALNHHLHTARKDKQMELNDTLIAHMALEDHPTAMTRHREMEKRLDDSLAIVRIDITKVNEELENLKSSLLSESYQIQILNVLKDIANPRPNRDRTKD